VEYGKTIDKLFKAAKAKDEFEYACTLLNFEGVQDAGWDPLQETIYIYEDIMGLLSAPLRADTRTRLALLLYCHLTEAQGIYKIMYNMLRVTQGDRYSAFPFHPLRRKLRNGETVEPTVRRIVREIDDYSSSNDWSEIGTIFKGTVNHELRNAFYHSDYTLHRGEFRAKGSWFMHANNVQSPVLSPDELSAIINAGINFFQAFMDTYTRHRRSYRANKKLQGRFSHDDSYASVTLLAKRAHGLYGFSGTGYDAPGVKA
jgi:hypothetical protein